MRKGKWKGKKNKWKKKKYKEVCLWEESKGERALKPQWVALLSMATLSPLLILPG